jgi:hypothetical protein
MNKKLIRSIEIAKCLQPQKRSGRSFHASFAFSKSKIVGIGWNSYDDLHLEHRFGKYHPTRGGENYIASRHSETQLLRRLKIPTKDLIITNVRIGKNGEILNAKPCANCQRCLDERGYKRILYSISEHEHGIIS